MKFCKYSIFVFHVYLVQIFLKLVNSVSLSLFVFLILFNACKYFERPLGNQLPKCVEGLAFLNKSHNNNNNLLNYDSKLQVSHRLLKMIAVGMSGGIKINKILALAGLTRARQCMGNNFAKGKLNLQKSSYTKFLI